MRKTTGPPEGGPHVKTTAVIALAGLLTMTLVSMTVRADAAAGALFSFHSNPWLNLHHFIRREAREARPKPELSQDERRIWNDSVAFYKPYAARDVTFDPGMGDIANALADAEQATSLADAAIDADLRATLERVRPIYRAHWWDEHDAANNAWTAAVQPLIETHGAALRDAIGRVYDTRWPDQPIRVDVSVVAGQFGAFATINPTHITISSMDPSYRGARALEMVFHEASHGFSALSEGVREAAARQHVEVPPRLWHAVLFYTAGELTRRELQAHGIAYQEYATPEIYASLCGDDCRARIVRYWTPRLDGRQSMADALDALVASYR